MAPSGTTFDGWYTAKTGGSKITSNSTVNISYETLYARWLVKVRLDCNGGNLGSYQGQEVKISDRSFIFGGTYSDLPQPVAPDGYKFVDWYTAKSGGEKITSAHKVTDVNITTLYARWTPQTYTVTFDSQGGSSVPKRTVTYNSSYGTSSNQLPNPSRSDYEFDGWYTASGAKINYYTTVTTASDHTLYAHWLNTYTIKFDPNGGSGAPGNQTKTHGKDLTISATCPKRTGYEFKGWGTSSTATKVSYAPGAKYTTNAAATLYAVWKPLTFKVDFYDGDTRLCTGTVTYDKPYGTLPEPTKTGYAFDGWYTANSGGALVTSSTKTTITAKQTLYAHWLNTYTIKFDPNGGSGAPDNQTKTHGKDLTISPTCPKRTGYEFKGWGTSPTTTTVSYASGSKYTANAAATLYAIWAPKEYTIKLNVNGGNEGSVPSSVSKKHGEDIDLSKIIPTTKKNGFGFAGWALKAASGVTEIVSIFTKNVNTEVYAVWVPDYQVCFYANGGQGGPGTVPKIHDQNC